MLCPRRATAAPRPATAASPRTKSGARPRRRRSSGSRRRRRRSRAAPRQQQRAVERRRRPAARPSSLDPPSRPLACLHRRWVLWRALRAQCCFCRHVLFGRRLQALQQGVWAGARLPHRRASMRGSWQLLRAAMSVRSREPEPVCARSPLAGWSLWLAGASHRRAHRGERGVADGAGAGGTGLYTGGHGCVAQPRRAQARACRPGACTATRSPRAPCPLSSPLAAPLARPAPTPGWPPAPHPQRTRPSSTPSPT